MAIGAKDLEGNEFGTIFAKAVNGSHLSSPLGVADVESEGCAWSAKTVKSKNPYKQRTVRLISGRNSPRFSSGIDDLFTDLAATGKSVLSIWNERVNEALATSSDLRIIVLVRNTESKEFLIFEEEAVRFVPDEYSWTLNKKGNIEGREIYTNTHKFTWQPNGSQFTIIKNIPASARKFSIAHDVPIVKPDQILRQIGYQQNWIQIVN